MLTLSATAWSQVPETAQGDPAGAVAPQSPEQRARALFEQGVAAVRAEQWQDAEQFFMQSAKLVERPNALLNWAIALVRLGRGREALAVIQRWFQLTAESASPAEKADALELERRAKGLVASLTLEVLPADARLEINGAEIPGTGSQRKVVLDRGVQRIVVSAPGFRSRRLELTLEGGETARSQVELMAATQGSPPRTAPLPAPPPPPRALEPAQGRSPGPLPYILLAAGGGLLLAGATTGVLALQADRDVSEACPSLRECDPSLESRQTTAKRLALATDVLLGIGLPALGAGAWLWLDSRGPEERRRVGSVTSFGAGLRRSW